MSGKLLVFGTVAYDCIETPSAKADFILGGSASYAALAASFFSPVKIVGIVGNDFKENDLNRLKARGIDVSGLTFDKDRPTFFWRGKYHENMNSRDTIDVRFNAFDGYVPKLDEDSKSCEYALLGNISPAHQKAVFDSMSNLKFSVLDTMDLYIRTSNAELREMAKKVDLLIMNDSEASLFTGDPNIINSGYSILENGIKSLIIKKGEHGALLFHKDGFFQIGSYPLRSVYDPTGAGDSFAGAFAGYIAKTGDASFENMKLAMLAATATASITLESFSCDKLENAGFDEIQRRMKFMRKISEIPEK